MDSETAGKVVYIDDLEALIAARLLDGVEASSLQGGWTLDNAIKNYEAFQRARHFRTLADTILVPS